MTNQLDGFTAPGAVLPPLNSVQEDGAVNDIPREAAFKVRCSCIARHHILQTPAQAHKVYCMKYVILFRQSQASAVGPHCWPTMIGSNTQVAMQTQHDGPGDLHVVCHGCL